MLVELNGSQLQGVDTTYIVYDGTNNNVEVGVDPAEAIGTITSGAIKVYINNTLQRFVIDYTYNGNINLVEIPAANLTIGDVIRIETNVRTQYSIANNSIVFSSDLTLVEDDIIVVTWFSEYPTMDIISDEYLGGKVQYQLPRKPLNLSYVWVYKNGTRLTQDRDYYVSLQRSVIYLTQETTSTDQIKIVQFGSNVYEPPKAFEIFKDMLNNYHYKRHARSNDIKLLKDLFYYDTSIEVTDSSLLGTPILNRNIPGVIIINGERIEYFEKNGNILSQLRRGSLGTAIAEKHDIGSFVIDVGAIETLPYLETQERTDFISDGSSLLIGPLDFVPPIANENTTLRQNWRSTWIRETIPEEFGPCDNIEIFVGGKRLRKDPLAVYDETKGATSTKSDIVEEAEFSVDGVSPYFRLTERVPAGTRILVIRKQGKIWYERGLVTASKGVSLLSNDTPIARFIAAKPTELPE
jgi:hypothetical protein